MSGFRDVLGGSIYPCTSPTYPYQHLYLEPDHRRSNSCWWILKRFEASCDHRDHACAQHVFSCQYFYILSQSITAHHVRNRSECPPAGPGTPVGQGGSQPCPVARKPPRGRPIRLCLCLVFDSAEHSNIWATRRSTPRRRHTLPTRARHTRLTYPLTGTHTRHLRATPLSQILATPVARLRNHDLK